MNNRYALTHLTVILSMCLLLLVVSTSLLGQNRAMQRQILVYIAADSLELPLEKLQTESISEIIFSSNRLRIAFQNIPLEKIEKTFPETGKDELLIENSSGIKIRKPNWERVFTIQLKNETSVKEVINRLKSEPSVLFAEPHSDLRLHSDGLYSQQWHLNNTGQSSGTPDADIDAPEAWQIFTGSFSVKLAILDTGVETNHLDLSGKSSGDTPESYPYNGYAHGTHVAGIAGAKLGGGDVRGVDDGVQIISRKVFSGHRYDYSQGRDVPNWAGDNNGYNKIISAVNNGADVLNHSYGGSQFSTILRSAFAYAYKMNRLSVASMGNNNSTTPSYPAAYGQGVLAVGSTTHTDSRSGFSNQGNHIDVTAPGSSIISTWRGNGYSSISGTSMAAPVVSGIATLLKGYNSSLYNDDIEHLIKLSAEDRGVTGFDSEYGHGRVNAHKALLRLQSPYVLNHHTATGGYVANVTQETKVFYDTPGLADGVYIVKRNEVRRYVSFPWMDEVHVWGRGVATNGYSAATPNFAMGWNAPTSVYNNNATLKTYVYEVFTTSGQRIGWYPTSPANATFAYTVHGKPGTPPLSVSISGAQNVTTPQSVTYTATASNGATPYQSYMWYIRDSGNTSWTSIGSSTSNTKSIYFPNPSNDRQIKVTVEDANLDYASSSPYNVSVFNSGGGGGFKIVSGEALPETFSLSNNYPNPFNPSTQIKFELPESAEVTVKVYNVMGQEVATLVNHQMKAGFHNTIFKADNLASGLYIARLTAVGSSGEQFAQEIKMQLIK